MINRKAWVVLAITPLAVIGGCTDKDPIFPDTEPLAPQLRIINAVHNLNTTTGTAIDLVVNGDLVPLGVAALPANEVREYVETSPGVHSFTTRISGQPEDTNLFGFVARQYLAEGQFYTMLVVGVNPEDGPPGANAVRPVILNRDPFPPAIVDGSYQARISFINGALYSSGTNPTGATVRMFVEEGADVVTDVSELTGLSPASTRTFANHFPQYVNLAPGTYVVTFATATHILDSRSVTIDTGDVRTFAVLSTGPAETPGPSNHVVHNLLDATY